MTKEKRYAIPEAFAKKTNLNASSYQALYQKSIENPEKFWAEQASEFISWHTPWESVLKGDFTSLDLAWFSGASLNACYNCLDRHLPARRDQIAVLWEGDEPGNSRQLTYGQLHEAVCRFANVLKKQGIKKGDKVCIYLPMIPEACIAMLACARIGAVHSVVFAGFSAKALETRILDAHASLLITSDESVRGGKQVQVKANADEALKNCPDVKKVIVVQRTGQPVDWVEGRDKWYHEEMAAVDADCPVEVMDSQDPLFILYTSGSTGKPKGVLHAVGGYMVYAATTFHYVFDYHEGDVYWCTADVGWITGHSYIVYGPLANGAITLMFEGTPHYPDSRRFWQIIDKYHVNIFYTAPTAIRALRGRGDKYLEDSKRDSLRLLGTVGEPINPEVWQWYFDVVGKGQCPVVDTWWQTETGGIMISPLPGAIALKPGSATRPFLGIVADIVDEQGKFLTEGKTGRLVIKKPWPGMMKTIYGDHQRFVDSYFKAVPGCYLTGDSAHFDKDGYFWIAGRDDDVIKISGHRLGTEELESAFVSHKAVTEAAVVGVEHEIKGQVIYAFLCVKEGIEKDEHLKKSLIAHVREEIGPIAQIETIQWANDLPKTRSGKIMRRILRKIAHNDYSELGDTSTLANSEVVDSLISDRQAMP
jgi:acetyl-CoA synthetase